MEEGLNGLRDLFGIDFTELSVLNVLARCIFIYVFGIFLLRVGNKRLLGKMTTFDTILAIVIGSLFSRAITVPGMFIEILLACLVLVLLHRFFAFLASHYHWFGIWIKGHDRIIVKDGEILWDEMKKSNLSERDLIEMLRLNAGTVDISRVQVAHLERNGNISFMLKEK